MTTTLVNNPWQALLAATPHREQAAPTRTLLPRHANWQGRPVMGTPREWSGNSAHYRRLPLSQVQHDCLMGLRYGFAVHEVANAGEASFVHDTRSFGYTLVTLRSLLKLGLVRELRGGTGYEITDYGLFLLCFFKRRA